MDSVCRGRARRPRPVAVGRRRRRRSRHRKRKQWPTTTGLSLSHRVSRNSRRSPFGFFVSRLTTLRRSPATDRRRTRATYGPSVRFFFLNIFLVPRKMFREPSNFPVPFVGDPENRGDAPIYPGSREIRVSSPIANSLRVHRGVRWSVVDGSDERFRMFFNRRMRVNDSTDFRFEKINPDFYGLYS